jgi:hypothetical protein
MAGFLFLGAGRRTFATSNEAVAALLISVFPRFPTSTSDNRCHLQVRVAAVVGVRAIPSAYSGGTPRCRASFAVLLG